MARFSHLLSIPLLSSLKKMETTYIILVIIFGHWWYIFWSRTMPRVSSDRRKKQPVSTDKKAKASERYVLRLWCWSRLVHSRLEFSISLFYGAHNCADSQTFYPWLFIRNYTLSTLIPFCGYSWSQLFTETLLSLQQEIIVGPRMHMWMRPYRRISGFANAFGDYKVHF